MLSLHLVPACVSPDRMDNPDRMESPGRGEEIGLSQLAEAKCPLFPVSYHQLCNLYLFTYYYIYVKLLIGNFIPQCCCLINLQFLW